MKSLQGNSTRSFAKKTITNHSRVQKFWEHFFSRCLYYFINYPYYAVILLDKEH